MLAQSRAGVYVDDIKTGLVDSFYDTVIGLLFDKPGCVFIEIGQGTRACDDSMTSGY